MSYSRVIPRDLFNEANLLKCYGQIFINLETSGLSHVELVHDDNTFDVEQDESDGSLFIANVVLKVHGKPQKLRRPMNSREPWPLILVDLEDEVDIPVFNDDGSFTEDLLQHFKR